MKIKDKKHRNILFLTIISLLIFVSVIIFFINSYRNFSTDKVAIIPIKGEISLYPSGSFFSPGGTSAESTLQKLENAQEDISVKAIILEINSPGGTVVATKEIVRAIHNFNKPVVAWIREIGASGGYWVASAADIIVADSISITGSIGVSGGYLEFSELFEKYGISYTQLVSGKYKDIGSPYKELTSEERELLLSKLNIIQELFIEDLKSNRNLTNETLEKLSTAEWFLGIEAKELGLIDIIGSKSEAIYHANALANISSSELFEYSTRKTFFQKIASVLSQSFYFVGKGLGDSFLVIQNKEVPLVK